MLPLLDCNYLYILRYRRIRKHRIYQGAENILRSFKISEKLRIVRSSRSSTVKQEMHGPRRASLMIERVKRSKDDRTDCFT